MTFNLPNEFNKFFFENEELFHVNEINKIMVISFRPRIGIEEAMTFNFDYNSYLFHRRLDKAERKKASIGLNESKEEKNEKIRMPRLKGKKMMKQQFKDDDYIMIKRDEYEEFNNKIIELKNYYQVLNPMKEAINECNSSTNSELDIPLCVKKMTSIGGEKQIHALDINNIVFEHKNIIQELIKSDRLSILREKGVNYKTTLNKMANQIATDMLLEDSIGLITHHTVVHESKISFKPKKRVIMNQEYDEEQQAQLEGKIKDVSEIFKSIILNQRLAMKSMYKEIFTKIAVGIQRAFLEKGSYLQSESDKVNPEDEARMAMFLSGDVPSHIKEGYDRVIKPLILKASRGSQALLKMKNTFNELGLVIKQVLLNVIYDLD
jgi:hypothetical protein